MPNDSYKPVRIDSKQAITKAAQRPGFTQAWEALEEGTTKSAISRLESSLRDEKHSPSFATLKKYAHACGKKLLVQLV